MPSCPSMGEDPPESGGCDGTEEVPSVRESSPSTARHDGRSASPSRSALARCASAGSSRRTRTPGAVAVRGLRCGFRRVWVRRLAPAGILGGRAGVCTCRSCQRSGVAATIVAMTSKLEDPAWRSARARKAAATRTSLEHHIAKVVDRAPELTSEQIDRLREIFRSESK